MEEKDYLMIQGQIDYQFKNRDLLQQAFVRRSYSKENGGADNEVLEFIGDKVLDIAVVRYLTDRFGYMSDKSEEYQEFFCEYSEGKLTQLKAQMVGKNSLARRIDELGFAEYLIMGNGDIQNSVAEEKSVKEDLFEAILGAVAKDSEWDFEKLQQVVEIMLNPDSFVDKDEENYVQMIQDWAQKKIGMNPTYRYYDTSYPFNNYGLPMNGMFYSAYSPYQIMESPKSSFYTCELTLQRNIPVFRACGHSKNEARKNVCRDAYEWLEKNNKLFTIQDEIENPNKNDAINQLETLARRGYFSVPTYEYREKYDDNGNPEWIVECHIDEEDGYHDAVSSSKREAKKRAAYDMLLHVLGNGEVK